MMRALLLLLPASLLGGCISLLPKPPPPPATFVMEAGEVPRAEGQAIDGVVGIATPEGERTILGSDVVWRTGDQIAFVAQTQWSGRAEDMLRAVLVDTMQRQGRFRAAVPTGAANTDFQVRWTVRNFEVTEAGMRARFVADVMVLAPGRRIVASEHIEADAPVADRSSTAAAQALTRAAREGSARIGLFAADAAVQEQTRAAAEQASRQGGVNQ